MVEVAIDRCQAAARGASAPVEFLPEEPGEHEFSCQMGMIRGKLVVV
jgi:plastocyanin domain-containing protein